MLADDSLLFGQKKELQMKIIHAIKGTWNAWMGVCEIHSVVEWGALITLVLLMLGCLVMVARQEWIRTYIVPPKSVKGWRAWAMKCFVAFCISTTVYFGGAKPSGGDSRGGDGASEGDNASRASERSMGGTSRSGGVISFCGDLMGGDTFGEIVCPTNFPTVTNLCFFGIAPTFSNVWLGVAWPVGTMFTNDLIDVYSATNLASGSWSHRFSVDVSNVNSNFVMCLPQITELNTNTPAQASFYRVASADDSDGDGISDAAEKWVYGTDPSLVDTDGDGVRDGLEVYCGLNPLENDAQTRPSSSFEYSQVFDVPYGCSDCTISFSGLDTRADRGGSSSRKGGQRAGDDRDENDDYPTPEFVGKLPQLPRDDSHPAHTYVFGMTASWTIRPNASGDYSFSIAADDEATLSFGGESVGVTWPVDHGQARSLTVSLEAGQTYPVSLNYRNSGGGAYFLTCLSDGTGYDPHIVVDPEVIVFNGQDTSSFSNCMPRVSIVGRMNPCVSYSVYAEWDEGLQMTGDPSCPIDSSGVSVPRAMPADDHDYWENNRKSMVRYYLKADGAIIDEASCIFVSIPINEEN